MAITIDSTTDLPESVKAQLAEAGDAVEEVKEEKETPALKEGEEKAEPAKNEPADSKEDKEEKSTTKEGTPKEEETKEEDWDKLPAWAKKQITKARERNRDLRDKLEDERAARSSRVPADAVKEKTEATDPTKETGFTYCGRPKPKFAEFEKAEDPYAAFAEAIGEWSADEKIAKREAEQFATQQANEFVKIQEAFEKRKIEASALVDDFDEVLEEATDIIASPAMQQVIYSSEVGAHILYHLAQNPAEAKRLYAMAPADTIKAMGRLEAKIEGVVETLKKATDKKESPKKKTASSAPAPETPVRGGPSKTKTLQELAGPNDREVFGTIKFDKNYEKMRNEQRRGR